MGQAKGKRLLKRQSKKKKSAREKRKRRKQGRKQRKLGKRLSLLVHPLAALLLVAPLLAAPLLAAAPHLPALGGILSPTRFHLLLHQQLRPSLAGSHGECLRC